MVSKRRNDERDYRRKAARRDPKFRILVVCEGKVTEPEYLEAFRLEVRNQRVHIEVAGGHGAPVRVVETAVHVAQEAADAANRAADDNLRFDSVWAVFDVDEHPNIDKARELARAKDVQLAISNPCFELWALLHFEDHRAHIERSALASRLRRHCAGYDKFLPFAKLQPSYDVAVARAQSLRKEAEEHGRAGRNPTTDVFELTELIRTK